MHCFVGSAASVPPRSFRQLNALALSFALVFIFIMRHLQSMLQKHVLHCFNDDARNALRADCQSVKAPAVITSGYDANKKIEGRKLCIAVEADGRLLAMNLTPADVLDPTSEHTVLNAL